MATLQPFLCAVVNSKGAAAISKACPNLIYAKKKHLDDVSLADKVSDVFLC